MNSCHGPDGLTLTLSPSEVVDLAEALEGFPHNPPDRLPEPQHVYALMSLAMHVQTAAEWQRKVQELHRPNGRY